MRRYWAPIFSHWACADFFSDSIGIFPAPSRQAFLALLSAALTFALLVEIWLQAVSATVRAPSCEIPLAASRHFWRAWATPAGCVVAVVVFDDEESHERAK